MFEGLGQLMTMVNSVTDEQQNKAMAVIDVILALPAQIEQINMTQSRIEQKLDLLLKELGHASGKTE